MEAAKSKKCNDTTILVQRPGLAKHFRLINHLMKAGQKLRFDGCKIH